ncbi:MAG: response regulator, partial [Cyclobacteriaceae bacterium]|nr:response regulator [Cyclobacteriaceae bacterium]
MRNGQILITDDDQTLCYLLKEELVNEGYAVDITFDGKYAIENLKKKTYDLLLLDLEMTDVQGEEVLKYTKEHHPNLQVIVLT